MKVHALSPGFGAEIAGIDLSQELDDRTFAAIEKIYNESSVVLFRDQHITDEQHVRFSRRLGELEIHVLKEYVKPHNPELYVLSNIVENGKPIGIKDAGNYWHTDLSYTKSPSRARSCTQSKCRTRRMACRSVIRNSRALRPLTTRCRMR